MAHNDDLSAKLEEIRQMFLQRVRDEWMGRIGALRGKLPNDWSRTSLEELMFLTHTLAGSGATFGYQTLSQTARKIEIAARALLRGESGDTPETRAVVLDGLAELESEGRLALGDLDA